MLERQFKLSRPGNRPCAPESEGRPKGGTGPGVNGVFLGTYAKLSALGFGRGFPADLVWKPSIDAETGEIKAFIDPMAGQVNRFILQSVSRKVLPGSRTGKCLRVRQGGQEIQVHKSIEHQKAHYSGLQTCGSVWVCPVCAAKIAERRRGELIAAMSAHKEQGGRVTMLTLTCPHQRTDDLVLLLAKQAKALHRFWCDKTVRRVFAEMGIIGQVKAAEVTHGRKSEQNNGWHPHYHVLQFGGFGGDLPPSYVFDIFQRQDWEDLLFERWAACCVAVGLGAPSRAHGLKLDGGEEAAKYITKWGLEDEMTKGHIKRAKHGETPFDFLRSLLENPSDTEADRLFKEFAAAFKGKHQLQWSKGLKARYSIGDVSDEELAARMDDLAVLLGTITADQWRDVLAVEGRGVVLLLAASGGWSVVQDYLGSIHVFKGEKNGQA